MNKLLIAILLSIGALPICGQTPGPSSHEAIAAASPASSPITEKIDPLKKQLILRVMAQTKEAEMAQERMLRGMSGMKLMMPRVPEKFWDKYRQLVSLEEIRTRLVSVYDKHYTTEDLNELLKFYDSPLGKKMSDEAVPILRESIDIAQELSKRAAQSVTADLQAEQLLQQPRAAAGLLGPPRQPQVGPMGSPGPVLAPTPSATAP